MGNKYYSLVASLPYLKMGEAPPLSVAGFMDECGKWLSPDDMAALEAAGDPGLRSFHDGSEILERWKEFDSALRKSVALMREARKKGQPFKAPDMLRSIESGETPLIMEKAIEEIRWDFLEDKALGYNFDINWLILYFLKLRIVERLAGFDKEKGEAIFYKLCEVKHEQAVR